MENISEQFKKVRESKGLSVTDVTRVLRIGQRYIEAIENDKFDELPEPVYSIGFIKNYADFLGLDTQRAIAEYKHKIGIALDKKLEISTRNEFPKSCAFAVCKEYLKKIKTLRIRKVCICNVAYVVLIIAVLAVIVDILF